MGIIASFVFKLIKIILYLAAFAAIVLLLPNLPPYTKFTKYEAEPTLPRTGALASNEALNNPQKLYEGKIHGPEAFYVHNGEVYTGLATGEIVKLSPGGHVTFVTKLGRPCAGLQQEHICGRPLGLKIDQKTNQLYVVDAYHGIWKVDLKTDKKHLLVSPDVEINGKKPKLFNDLTLDSNGDLFWTDSSSEFTLKDGSHSVFLDPSGRLFHYKAAKNVSTLVADNLGFANGIVMSPDGQFVLVSETMLFKVTKIYIRGPKKGRSEVFVAGLPGIPDNMRALPDGSGVLVALYTVFDDEHPLLAKTLQPLPLLRKFIIRTLLMVENTFHFLNTQVPHPILENIVYNLGHFKSLSGLLSGKSGLVQLDWSGNIVASYFSTDGNTPTISDAIVFNDRLWTGAPHAQDYIATFPAPPLLKKAFTPSKIEAPVKQNVETPRAAPPPPQAQKVDNSRKQTTPPPPAQEKQTPPVEKKQTSPVEKKQTSPPVEKKQTPPVEKKQTPPPTQRKETPPPVQSKQTPPKPAENKQSEKRPAQQTTPPPVQKQPSKPVESKPQQTTPPPAQPAVQQRAAPAVKSKTVENKQPAAAPQQPKQNVNAQAGAGVKPNVESTPTRQTVPEKTKAADKINVQSKDQQKTPPPLKTDTKQPPRADKQIPVKEEIPSDTAQPSNEKLKVIKKSGPGVIPNPAA